MGARTSIARAALALAIAGGLGRTGHAAVSQPPDALATPPGAQAKTRPSAAPKTVVDLQPFRSAQSLDVEGKGGRSGRATLVNLNPTVNAWYVLTLTWADGSQRSYHLENARPTAQDLVLDPAYRAGLVVRSNRDPEPCDLWLSDTLAKAAGQPTPYAPLCAGRVYLRNPVPGRRTELEATVEFLRDNVWAGETIIGLAKDTLFKDAELERARLTPGPLRDADASGGPRPAAVDPALAGRAVQSGSLGIRVDARVPGQMGMGRWYRAVDRDHVYVSLIEPEAVAPQILESHRSRVSPLDPVERSALVYLVAFDLGAFDLAYVVGSDHPRVDWSPRPPASVRPAGLPGPDGIGTVRPLITTGMVTPRDAGRTVATFAGGFKRAHGAFKYGDLAARNAGTHYGFVEEGVVLSKLQPGLATLYVSADGSVHMKTWKEGDEGQLPRVRYARQNGVALVEPDAATGAPVPGPLVNRWGPGNWSGSAEGDLRSARAGGCIQEGPGGRFLVYGYFSSATPSAMARVFQAYECEYAMLLDMNALVHTYMALYPERGPAGGIQHLVRGMAEADPVSGGRAVPRFLGLPDDRDFFYLLTREQERTP
jgi:hypothetical protein